MIYRLIHATPQFPEGYTFDSQDPEAPVQLLRYFVANPDWFEIVIGDSESES